MVKVKVNYRNKVFEINVAGDRVVYNYPFHLLRNEESFFSQIMGHRWADWYLENELISAVSEVKRKEWICKKCGFPSWGCDHIN